MLRTERIKLLTELLARVRRNAAELELTRGIGPPIPEAAAADCAPTVPTRALRSPIPPPPLPRLQLVSEPPPDDWSSLPELSEAVPAEFVPWSEVAAPRQVTELTKAASEDAMEAAPTAEHEEVEAAPESQLERALRSAAETRPLSHDRHALWLEAAEELRERRTTAPPAPPESGVSHAMEPMQPAPAPSSSAPAELPVAPAPPRARRPRKRERPSPPSLPPNGDSPSRRVWPILAGVFVGGLAASLAIALVPSRAQVLSATIEAAQSPPQNARTNLDDAPRSLTTHSGNRVAVPTTIPTASAAPRLEALPAAPRITRPKEHGLLWVDAPAEVLVYVQGLPVGAGGSYLEVRCGLRNVRVARPDPPPAGHSFPLWLGEAQTVLIPCGSVNRIRMAAD